MELTLRYQRRYLKSSWRNGYIQLRSDHTKSSFSAWRSSKLVINLIFLYTTQCCVTDKEPLNPKTQIGFPAPFAVQAIFMVQCFCTYYSSDVSVTMCRSFCVLYLFCSCWYSHKLDLIWFDLKESLPQFGYLCKTVLLNLSSSSSTPIWFNERWVHNL